MQPTTIFHTLEAVTPKWEPFANGVDYFHGKTALPLLEFWALRIDLNTASIVVKHGGNSPLQNGEDHARSAKVTSFVRNNGLLAGINTVPFDIVSSKEGQPIKNVGLVISEGIVLSPINKNYDALVFYKNGRAAVVKQSSIQSFENIDNATGGFHQILSGGEPAARVTGQETPVRHPRSAAGVAANGKVLYLLVIDGRRAGSVGATEMETALLLRALGSYDAINFDGGGSSALALRYPDGGIKTANRPVHGGIPGTERAVAGCLGIGVRD